MVPMWKPVGREMVCEPGVWLGNVTEMTFRTAELVATPTPAKVSLT